MITEYRNKILQGHTFDILSQLPSHIVDCIITSPPYWGLRDYKTDPIIWDGDPQCDHEWITQEIHLMHDNRNFQTGTQEEVHGQKGTSYIQKYDKCSAANCVKCHAWKGSLGQEPTIDLYIKHLCDIFGETKRVLKKNGTCWINIGDTYSSMGGLTTPEHLKKANVGATKSGAQKSLRWFGGTPELPQKSLCLVPFQFALEMQKRKWICRNVIIWQKPNCLPSPAKDRFTVDFEYLFFFVQQPKYYFEQQFEPMSKETFDDIRRRKKMQWTDGSKGSKHHSNEDSPNNREGRSRLEFFDPHGRNKRAVWSINPLPFKDAHFAVFPIALVKIPLEAGCPQYICVKCGTPRIKLYEEIKSDPIEVYKGEATKDYTDAKAQNPSDTKRRILESMRTLQKPKGWSDCGCNAGWQTGIVLDPFLGSGTTALVALKNHRQFIGIELNPAYVKIAYKRVDPYLHQHTLADFGGK